jgi:hypothetical protein
MESGGGLYFLFAAIASKRDKNVPFSAAQLMLSCLLSTKAKKSAGHFCPAYTARKAVRIS